MSLATKRHPQPSKASGGNHSLSGAKKDMPIFGAPRKVERRDDKLSSYANEVLGDFPLGSPLTNSDLGAFFSPGVVSKCSTNAFSKGEPSSHGSFTSQSANSNGNTVRGAEVAARKSSHAAKPEKNSSSAPTGRPSRQVLNGLPAKTSTTAAASHAPTPTHRDAKFSSVHGNGLSNSQPPDKKRKAVEPPLPAQPLFVVPDLTAKKAAPTPARARLAAKRASPGVPPPKKQGGLGRGKNIKFCMDSSSEQEEESRKERVEAIFEEMGRGKFTSPVTKLADTPVKLSRYPGDPVVLSQDDLTSALNEAAPGSCQNGLAEKSDVPENFAKRRRLSSSGSSSSSSSSDSDSDSSSSSSSSSGSSSDSSSDSGSSSESEVEADAPVPRGKGSKAGFRAPTVSKPAVSGGKFAVPSSTPSPCSKGHTPAHLKPVAIVPPHQSVSKPPLSDQLKQQDDVPKEQDPQPAPATGGSFSPLLTKDAEDQLLQLSDINPMSLNFSTNSDPLSLQLDDVTTDQLARELRQSHSDPLSLQLGNAGLDVLSLDVSDTLNDPLALALSAPCNTPLGLDAVFPKTDLAAMFSSDDMSFAGLGKKSPLELSDIADAPSLLEGTQCGDDLSPQLSDSFNPEALRLSETLDAHLTKDGVHPMDINGDLLLPQKSAEASTADSEKPPSMISEMSSKDLCGPPPPAPAAAEKVEDTQEKEELSTVKECESEPLTVQPSTVPDDRAAAPAVVNEEIKHVLVKNIPTSVLKKESYPASDDVLKDDVQTCPMEISDDLLPQKSPEVSTVNIEVPLNVTLEVSSKESCDPPPAAVAAAKKVEGQQEKEKVPSEEACDPPAAATFGKVEGTQEKEELSTVKECESEPLAVQSSTVPADPAATPAVVNEELKELKAVSVKDIPACTLSEESLPASHDTLKDDVPTGPTGECVEQISLPSKADPMLVSEQEQASSPKRSRSPQRNRSSYERSTSSPRRSGNRRNRRQNSPSPHRRSGRYGRGTSPPSHNRRPRRGSPARSVSPSRRYKRSPSGGRSMSPDNHRSRGCSPSRRSPSPWSRRSRFCSPPKRSMSPDRRRQRYRSPSRGTYRDSISPQRHPSRRSRSRERGRGSRQSKFRRRSSTPRHSRSPRRSRSPLSNSRSRPELSPRRSRERHGGPDPSPSNFDRDLQDYLKEYEKVPASDVRCKQDTQSCTPSGRWRSSRINASMATPKKLTTEQKSATSRHGDADTSNSHPVVYNMARPIGALAIASKARHLKCLADWLEEAKRLKHKGDATNVRNIRACFYVEASICFIRSGHDLEITGGKEERSRAVRIYADTLLLLSFLTAVPETSKKGMAIWKSSKEIGAIAFRCKAILCWHVMTMSEEKLIRHHKVMNDGLAYIAKKQPNSQTLSPFNLGSMRSPAVSPGAAMASNSQELGSSLHSSCASAPHSLSSSPANDKATNGLPSHLAQEGLALCHDMKMNLDMLRSWKHSEELLAECGNFFSELERDSHAISLTSPLLALLEWAYMGIRRLKKAK